MKRRIHKVTVMNARYTSPGLARQLAEAGLEQWLDGTMHYWLDGSLHRMREGFGGVDPDVVRALDLTDILAELTRPRPEEADARPLCDAVSVDLCNSTTVDHPFTSMARAFDHEENEMASVETGSPVEAAALVLLALLRERRKP